MAGSSVAEYQAEGKALFVTAADLALRFDAELAVRYSPERLAFVALISASPYLYHDSGNLAAVRERRGGIFAHVRRRVVQAHERRPLRRAHRQRVRAASATCPGRSHSRTQHGKHRPSSNIPQFLAFKHTSGRHRGVRAGGRGRGRYHCLRLLLLQEELQGTTDVSAGVNGCVA